MARIKYASIVSSVSGSVGSATFQKSLYGDTLRNKPRPRISHTPSQYNSRAIMMRVHNAWAGLTAAERTQWNQFISFASATIRRDRSVLQSGHSYFIKLNFMRLLCGLAVQTVPLYGSFEVGNPTFNLSWEDYENNWEVQINATNPGTDLWFVLKLSSKISENNSFRKAGLRYMDITVSDDENYAMKTIYQDVFGYLLQSGDWVSYSIQYFGLTSSLISGVYTGTKKLF